MANRHARFQLNNLTIRYAIQWFKMWKRNPTRFVHDVKIGLRYYRVWKRHLQPNANALSDRLFWITYEARAFLESVLDADWNVFEYGSGGSTLYFGHRVQAIVSLEHDQEWYARVQDALAHDNLHNCTLLFVPPEPNATTAAQDSAYSSCFEEFRDYHFRAYVEAIDSYPDHTFDLVVIDGRARVACAKHAHRKVKPGGYLMLDDSERPRYQAVQTLLSGWEAHPFFGPGPYARYFAETTFWMKPHMESDHGTAQLE